MNVVITEFEAKLENTRMILKNIAQEFSPAVFASSLAAEDMVLTDLILREKLNIGIFSLETGRLHAETLGMLDKVKATYGTEIVLYKPEASAVEAYVAQHGLNAFYDSVDMRKECCRIRKVEPLNRALAGNKAWVTGQRRAQAATRTELSVQEDDIAHGMQNLTLLQIGLKRMCGTTFAAIMCRTTRYTTKAILLLVANLVLVRYNLAKMCVPDAGGGKIQNQKNVVCMSSMAN